MNRTKRIEKILKKHFIEFDIKVIDNSFIHKGHNNFDGSGETHILVEFFNNSKFKINRLEIHRKVNFLLEKEFKEGLHSIEIKII
tara:strand:- start:122 stop:376 length:255 start_codon:yes stop_codon:yes gene_type:complete